MTLVTQQQKRLMSYVASFRQGILNKKIKNNEGGAVAGATFLLVSMMMTTIAAANHHLLSRRSRLEEQEGSTSSSSASTNNDPSFQIEIDFMDKLANKSYLRLYSKNSSRNNNTMTGERPMGVPHSLRLLSVDVPELRRGFRTTTNKSSNYYVSSSRSSTSWCSQVSNRVYTDGVASPKLVQVMKPHHLQKDQQQEEEITDGKEDDSSAGDDGPQKQKKKRQQLHNRRLRRNKKNKDSSVNAIEIEIDQKVWVKSMYECYTSTKGLNNPSIQIVEANTRALNPRQLRRTYPFAVTNAITNNESTSNDSLASATTIVIEDESDAPWNQYAWLEEMELRISGNVPFGDPLEPANWYNKLLFGHIYNRGYRRSSDDKRRSWLSALTTSSKQQQQISDSNKPHAVIANRTQMQSVPHALRRLQAICRLHDVPLFVIDDTTIIDSDDLGDVLRQVRASVKERIVLQSIKESSAWAYNWGRYVGQIETEAKLRSQQLSRQVTQVLMRSSSSGNRRNKKKEECWSKYNATELESELAKRGILIDATSVGSGVNSSSNNTKGYCNDALVALSRRCIAASEEGQRQQQKMHTERSSSYSNENVGEEISTTTA